MKVFWVCIKKSITFTKRLQNSDTKMNNKILIVDDEQEICEILKYNLEVEGYEVDIAFSAEEAMTLNISSYSLIILDVMMDSISGFEMARRLKKDPATMYTPIIFCSALSGEDEHIMGLNIGADDYITKPFRTREVLARVKSVIRRSRMTRELNKIPTPVTPPAPQKKVESESVYLGLRLDHNAKQCYVNNEIVNLTKTEYELLTFLLNHRNNIYTRKELLEKIWNNTEDVSNRTIDTNITRLRKKIGEYGSCIITRLGYGYGFQEPNI